MLVINGTTVKEPKSIEFGIQDVDGEAYRNAKGDMVRDRLPHGVKRSLSVEWGPLTKEELSTILTNCSAPSFSVYYFDGQTGSYQTKTFYVGDRTAPVYSFNEKFQALMWEGASMDFIEI